MELERIALRVRRHILTMIAKAGSGHPGGSLSIVEILTLLYFHLMRIDPRKPDWPDRDRLILSKGHACPAWYAVLAEKGFFPVEELLTLRRLGSRLQGHPDMRKTPGVEASTGSLGQGLSFANGVALAGKLDGKSYRVYAILGDGETQEGQVWEAAMASAHYKLDNLTAVLDFNGLQIDGRVADVMSPLPVHEKWAAFGWNVISTDGHDFDALAAAFEEARRCKGRPTMIVAKTTKGKGISFMEDQVEWHGRAPSQRELELGLRELGEE